MIEAIIYGSFFIQLCVLFLWAPVNDAAMEKTMTREERNARAHTRLNKEKSEKRPKSSRASSN